MPYCPKCRSEFMEGIKKCGECLEKLVEKLPDETVWEVAHICTHEDEACLIQGFLEGMGVPCVIESKRFHAEPVNLGITSEIELHVPHNKLEEASKLIKERNEKKGE